MTFLLAEPKEIDHIFCKNCYERTDHLAGISFRHNGFSPAWRCTKCGNVQVEDNGNPFDEINDKLDQLLRWSGHTGDGGMLER